MFPPRTTSGIPTRSLSRAFVAVLALLLSALGGIRLAFDRLGGPEEETVLVAAVAAQSRRCDCSRESAMAESAACPSRRAVASWPAALAGYNAPLTGPVPCAPTMLQGSAGGPRAP